MSMGNLAGLGAIAVSAMVLTGCGVADYQGEFDAYMRDYRAAVAYTEYSIPRDAGKLFAREFVPAAASDKPAFVLLHGFPDSLHLYDRLSPMLARDRRTIAFDFLGWGRSDKPAGHRYDTASLRADLDAVIDYFKLARVVLVAHDASGFPVIDWALDNPDRTAGIVLLNTVYTPSKSVIAPEAVELFSTPGIQRDISIFATTLFDGLWQSRHWEQVAKFYCDESVRDRHLKILSQQSLAIRPAFFGLTAVLRQAIADRARNLPRMRKFTPPVLIVFGNEDRYLNRGVAREFDEIFPNSTLNLVQGACHYVQLDAPATVAKIILNADMR